jgi:molybdate transport system ATP-binding protein
MDPLLKAAFEHRFPEGASLRAELELPLGKGSVSVLFGPSGSGKTTLLRILAGLERPQSGRITSGAEVWFDAQAGIHRPPWKRDVGFLFQDYALFPHLSVEGNLAYGLGGVAPQERRARIGAMLDLLGLSGLETRRPGQLSGGQQQRVALGRALVRRPAFLLLDEPLSALDWPTQEALRRELSGWLRELGTPALLVTHDRTEALTLGDRLLLLHEGRVRQAGTPTEVFARPTEPELASLLGIGTVVKVAVLGREHGLVRVAAGTAELWAPDPGGLEASAFACIRGEGVNVEQDGGAHQSARNRLPARVVSLEAQGALVRLHLDAGFPLEALVTAWACEDLSIAPGMALTAIVKATAIHLIPAE